VLGTAGSLEEAKMILSAPETARADILLLDIRLENDWGLDIIPRIRRQKREKIPAVVVYSGFDDYAHVSAALSLGAQGYITKKQGETDIEAALVAVLSDRTYIDRSAELKLQSAARARGAQRSFSMKNRFKLLGIIALVTVSGIAPTGCSTSGDGGSVQITITGLTSGETYHITPETGGVSFNTVYSADGAYAKSDVADDSNGTISVSYTYRILSMHGFSGDCKIMYFSADESVSKISKITYSMVEGADIRLDAATDFVDY
jgi:CheY-like chemotaxis protein